MGDLKYLDLDKTTSLASLPEGVFDRLGKLETLDLRDTPALASLTQSTRQKLEAQGCEIITE